MKDIKDDELDPTFEDELKPKLKFEDFRIFETKKCLISGDIFAMDKLLKYAKEIDVDIEFLQEKK